jgi:hypothetical protein
VIFNLCITDEDMTIILNSLSYAHWNDREMSEKDRDYLDGLYQSLENLSNNSI